MGSKTPTKTSTTFNQLGFVGANQRELCYVTVIFPSIFFCKTVEAKVEEQSLR